MDVYLEDSEAGISKDSLFKGDEGSRDLCLQGFRAYFVLSGDFLAP